MTVLELIEGVDRELRKRGLNRDVDIRVLVDGNVYDIVGVDFESFESEEYRDSVLLESR